MRMRKSKRWKKMASASLPRLLSFRGFSATLGRASFSNTAATFRACKRPLLAASNSQKYWNTAGNNLSGVPRVPTSAAVSLALQRWSSGITLTVQELEEQVLSVLKMFDKVKPEEVTLDAHFINDLGMDSLDAVEVVMAFEDEFGCEITDEEAEKIFSARDAVELLKTKIDMQHSS